MNRAPYSEPTTSKDAATSIGSVAATLRELVYNKLASLENGATEQELEVLLNLTGNTLRPRLWELEGNYLYEARIVKTENTRPTRSGRLARVYKIL